MVVRDLESLKVAASIQSFCGDTARNSTGLCVKRDSQAMILRRQMSTRRGQKIIRSGIRVPVRRYRSIRRVFVFVFLGSLGRTSKYVRVLRCRSRARKSSRLLA